MDKLERIYGKRSFDSWYQKQPSNLRSSQTSPDAANKEIWQVSSFNELFECISFLATMNKRLVLFFRGQTHNYLTLLPTLYRERWSTFEADDFEITDDKREKYWEFVNLVGEQVYKIIECLGLPRSRGFRNTREIQWAVIQHYNIWPTPLIDLTSSLRVAATFAMDFQVGEKEKPREGYVYVVGMPHSTGSITFDHDQHICLMRLLSACPPKATRPHFQDGFLVGYFPLHANIKERKKQSDVCRRLIAKFQLTDDGDFWNDSFPILRRNALFPAEDKLADEFAEHFGHGSKNSIYELASKII